MPIHLLIAALILGGGPWDETPAEQFARVESRVRQWQPTAEERRFDEIGWASGVRDAIRIAGKSRRPVFLFTHDGHMNVGRC